MKPGAAGVVFLGGGLSRLVLLGLFLRCKTILVLLFASIRDLANSVLPIATTGDVRILVLPGTINGDLAFVLLKGIASRFSLAVGDFRSECEGR